MASSVLLSSNVSGATAIQLAQGTTSGIWLSGGPDSLNLPIPVYDEDYAESPDAEGAQLVRSSAAAVHGSLAVTIRGTTAPDFYAQQDTWQQVIEAIRRCGGTLAYTPDGGTQVTYDIESAYITEMPQDSVRIANKLCESKAELVFQPYGRLPTYTANLSDLDPFNNDTISAQQWRFDAGSGTIAVTSGQLVPSSTANKILYRNIKVGDSTGYLKFTTGASVAATHATYIVLKRLDSSNYLFIGLDSTSGATISKVDGGASSNLSTSAFTLSTGTTYWLSAGIVGNAVTVNLYTADPNGTSPTAAVKTLAFTLTGATATKFGSGILGNPGMSVTPKGTDWRYDDWRLDSAAIQSAEPLINAAVFGVTGSVEALGKATLTDAATQNRRHVEIGLDDLHFDPTAPPLAILDSDILSTTGLAGSGSTQSGAYDPAASGNSVIATSTLIPTAQGICGTPVLASYGDRKVKARVYGSGTGDIFVRLAYREGDANWTRQDWVQLPVLSSFVELTLGTVQIRKAIAGAQRWEARVEAYSENPGDTIKVDYMKDLPARRYAKARAERTSQVSGALTSYDTFLQTAGSLTGKVAPLGGTWTVGAAGTSTAEDGDADDFAVVAGTSNWLTRTAFSDSSVTNGRFVSCGTTSQTATTVQADVKHDIPATPSPNECRTGVYARFVDTDNWLMAVRTRLGSNNYYGLYKRVAGTVTTLGNVLFNSLISDTNWYTLRLVVDTAGNASVYSALQGQSDLGTALITVTADANLATGGALQTGKQGVFDSINYTLGTGGTRYIDNFSVTVPSSTDLTQTVINSGKSAELRHNAFLRQSSDSLAYQRYPSEGSYLKIMPAGRELRAAQIVAQARRNDIDAEADDTIGASGSDLTTLALDITPRVPLISR